MQARQVFVLVSHAGVAAGQLASLVHATQTCAALQAGVPSEQFASDKHATQVFVESQ